MRVKKVSDISDDKTRFAFEVFDKTVIRFAHLIPYSSIIFFIGKNDDTEKTDAGILVSLDYNNIFVQEKDETILRISILRNILKLAINGAMPDFIENIIVDRILIKEGLGDELACYYFLFLKDAVVSNLDQFLELNAAWISFFGLDNYNSNMMKNLVKKRVTGDKFRSASRLFSLLKKELTNTVINKIIKEYEAVQCKL